MKLGMLVYISLSYERLLSDGMPASTLYHTFGSTIRNPRKSTPTMCLILTLLLNTCRNEPLAPASDFRTLPKSSASTIITTIQPAASANAGAALNMNLAAVIAIMMAAASQTTMNTYSAVVRLGILTTAHARPRRDR